MRHRRWPRITPYEDTPRKRAALQRSQRQARERLPLLGALIREGQPDTDTEMARRAVWWPKAQQEARDRRAADWRRARARLFGQDADLRRDLRRLWGACPYPADPTYLLDLLHGIDAGRIDPLRPPWQHPRETSSRPPAYPTTFDQAFRQIGQRTVGGGPKATGADAFTFIGRLGDELIVLTTRVRLIEPNESFYTPSNMRLRDSHVGRAGHYVDIEVRGRCSDAHLALIERLARDADERPVVVRRVSQPAARGS